MFLFIDGDKLVNLVALRGFDSEDSFHGGKLENDTIGMHFHRLNVFIGQGFDQVFFLESKEHEGVEFNAENDVFLNARDLFLNWFETLFVYLDLKLLGLVESIVGEDFDEEEGDGDEFILLGWDDFEDFLVVELEVREGDFVGFFSDFLDKCIDLILLERHVNIHGKEAHKGNHKVFFECIGEYLSPNNRQLELKPDKIDFIEWEFFLLGEIIVATEHIVDPVGKGIQVDGLLVVVDAGDGLVVVRQAFGWVVLVANLEDLELRDVEQFEGEGDLGLEVLDLGHFYVQVHLDRLPVG